MVGGLRYQLRLLTDTVYDRLRGEAYRQAVFHRIYAENLWGDPESVSGRGSNPVATETIRRELPILFKEYRICSLLDAPCGDFLWMKEVVGCLDRYVGVDIVPELIEQNTIAYRTERVAFICADITADTLPQCEMVLCRDCLIHLPTRLIRRALQNFQASGARYLLLTNERDTEGYQEIPIGSFRPINFTRPPFSFPQPLATLSEDATGSRQLCLWELASLSVTGG
jgi:hypothetical protein